MATEKTYKVSETTKALIEQTVERVFGERLGSDSQGKGKNQSIRGTGASSECLIVKTPSGGIAAADLEDSPPKMSSALCEVYSGSDIGELVDTLRTEVVWNLSSSEISANAIVVAIKDKSGKWVAFVGGGGIVPLTEPCECGDCVTGGAIDDCVAIGDATTEYSIPLTGILALEFGDTVILTHVSSCTWESDLFEDVDLGDGDHDYKFKLVFSGTSIEEAELTLEDET